MYNTQKLLINLIKSAVCGTPCECTGEITESELNSLYNISNKHDLTQMIVAPLEEMSVLKPEYAVTEKFKKALFTAIYRYEKSNYDLNQICELFSKKGIDHIPLKGAVIRNYYPKPYFRTSCDLDILVKQEDVERATELLTSRLNYRFETKGRYDVSLFAPSGGHIELHFGLNGNDFRKAKSLVDVWESGELSSISPNRFVMSPELFLLFHVYHMAKHFVHGGCGIKPFIDLWIVKNKIGYDKERAEKMLHENELLEFYKNALTLSEIWFDGKEYTPIAKDMEDYVLYGGVYGTLEQHVAMSQSKKGGKLGHILSRLFVSYDTLVVLYPSLRKCPLLFPLYQIRRWFRVLSPTKRRRALNEMKLNQNISAIKKEKAKNLLDELGL